MADAVVSYFADEDNMAMLNRLLEVIEFEEIDENTEEMNLEGKVFVITGSLNHFENRNALKAEIEKRGGKVTGSVSSKTDYLINNDSQSTSSKNKKAHELGVAIITEDEFIEMIK